VDDALAPGDAARDAGEPLSIGLLGNAAELLPGMLAMGAPIDVVTDQTSAHDPLTYLPRGVAFEDMAALRAEDPAGLRAGPAVDGRPVEAMVGFAGAAPRCSITATRPRRGAAGRVLGPQRRHVLERHPARQVGQRVVREVWSVTHVDRRAHGQHAGK